MSYNTRLKLYRKQVEVMPYKSEAQRKYFNANKKKLGKAMVEHWNKATGNKKLPKYAPKPKRK